MATAPPPKPYEVAAAAVNAPSARPSLAITAPSAAPVALPVDPTTITPSSSITSSASPNTASVVSSDGTQSSVQLQAMSGGMNNSLYANSLTRPGYGTGYGYGGYGYGGHTGYGMGGMGMGMGMGMGAGMGPYGMMGGPQTMFNKMTAGALQGFEQTVLTFSRMSQLMQINFEALHMTFGSIFRLVEHVLLLKHEMSGVFTTFTTLRFLSFFYKRARRLLLRMRGASPADLELDEAWSNNSNSSTSQQQPPKLGPNGQPIPSSSNNDEGSGWAWLPMLISLALLWKLFRWLIAKVRDSVSPPPPQQAMEQVFTQAQQQTQQQQQLQQQQLQLQQQQQAGAMQGMGYGGYGSGMYGGMNMYGNYASTYGSAGLGGYGGYGYGTGMYGPASVGGYGNGMYGASGYGY